MVTRLTPLPFPRQKETYGEAIIGMIERHGRSGYGGAIPVGDTTIISHPTGIDSLPTEDYMTILAELRLLGKI